MKLLRNGKEDPTPWYEILWRRVRSTCSAVWYLPKKTYRFLRKLYAWSPILWNDFDWDYSYLLKILEFKLHRMADTIESNGIIVASDRVAKQIRYATFLIERIQEENYCKEEYAAHEEKWGEGVMNFVDLPKDDPHYGTCSEMNMYTIKSKQQGLEDQEKKEHMVIYERARDTRQKDLDRLFRHMRRYLERWWD